jgi:hypothetical protein
MSVISGHAETEKFCNNQRGGAKFLVGGTVFVFLQPPPAACTIPGYEINLRQLQPLGNKHGNHSRHTLHDTLTTISKPGFGCLYFLNYLFQFKACHMS